MSFQSIMNNPGMIQAIAKASNLPPGKFQSLRYPLFDTMAFSTTGAGPYKFFTAPVGSTDAVDSAVKDYSRTTLEGTSGGSMPAGNAFWIDGISIGYGPATTIADALFLQRTLSCVLKVGTDIKQIFTPTQAPAAGGLFYAGTQNDVGLVTNGLAQERNAMFIPPEELRFIPAGGNFQVVASLISTPSLSAITLVSVTFWGLWLKGYVGI